MSHETTQLNAMADLAREWCCDFEEPEQPAHRSSLSTVDSDKSTECTPAPVQTAQTKLL